jgi:four helix bundle protein
MRRNIVRAKSFAFAVRVVNLNKFLRSEKTEFVLSKQLLRCGTSVGAAIREAEYAESKLDFKHKLQIAQKEINESIYWLELLRATNYLDPEQFESINKDAVEIIKLLTSIINTTKLNISEKCSVRVNH